MPPIQRTNPEGPGKIASKYEEDILTVYFAEEVEAKPEPDVIHKLLKDHDLLRRDILMIENSETDRHCADVCGIDYINAEEFL